MDARKPRQRLLGPALRTQPDRRLVALARDGSTPAQEEIVRRYRAALVRYAGSIVGPAAAEDVVQETLAKGLAALGGADEDLRLRPWLYAIVRNTALNHLRDAGPAIEQLDENYDGVEQPPQALERREGIRALVGGLRRLPRQQREAIVKRELEGRSHDEIAAELGVSTGAARQLIFRAREGLRIGLGSLLPMPLLRWLAEGGAGDAAVGVAAGAGGGTLAAKAVVAVFAAGAAVTAGVAIDNGGRQRPVEPPAAAEAAVRPALALPDGSGAAEPVAVVAGSGESSSAGDDGSGRGSDSSGPGPGGEREHGEGRDDQGGDGPEPGAHSGPGRGGDENDDDFDSDGVSAGHGERSGHGGASRDDGDDDHSTSSESGRDSSHSGSNGSDDGESDRSGSESSSGSGDSSGGGGDDHFEDVAEDTIAISPTSSSTSEPAPAPVEESSSGSGSSSGSDDSIDEERDLSSGDVSQGSDDPD